MDRGSEITRAQSRGAQRQRCCPPAGDMGTALRRMEESERRASPHAAEPTQTGAEGRNGAQAVRVLLYQTIRVLAANDLPGLNLRRKGGNAMKAALPGRSRGGGEGMEPLRYTSPCCLWLCHCLGSDLESMG